MNRSSRFVTLALVTAAAITISSGILGAGPNRAQAQTDTPSPRTITVVGYGSVFTQPDIAYLQVGVDIQNADLAAAIKDADAKINAILEALKKAEIAESDIQTVQYNIYRDGGYPMPATSEQPQQPPYHVVNVVRVTVRTLTKVGDILNAAVGAGANLVNSIEFTVKDTQVSESGARKAALDNAKTRATELAANVGATLGDVVSIEETGGFAPFGKSSRTMEAMGGAGGIVAGSFEVSVNLIVTYSLK
jgi:uncharacterized protein